VSADVNHVNWFWIAVALTVPGAVGGLAAYPFWRMGQPIFGNIIGTVVIFGAAIAFIMREHFELDFVVQACLAGGTVCFPEPSAFTRFAVYAFIGLFEVIALFSISLRVDTAVRRRGYAPEWR
jgi:hypothetical protein